MGVRNGGLIIIIMDIQIIQSRIYMKQNTDLDIYMERRQGMIGGDKMTNGITGLDKVLEIKPNFIWHHLNYIEGFKYYIDFNDQYDEVSFIEIKFLMRETGNKNVSRVLIKFSEINGFEIKEIGGNFNQVMGFEIIDQKGSGWEPDKRYSIRDYENGCIKFYCKSIEVLSVTEM